jgi:acetyl esterase
MSDDPRWDPEMRAAFLAGEAAAAARPLIRLEQPIDPQRPINDALALASAQGGPAMAETIDRWVSARGRRVLCRIHRPRTDRALPAMVFIHGGGWVWCSIDTHDRLMREYAAASGAAVVAVDYALSPEARFPQALEECAAVVRHVAAHGAEWGIDGARIALGGDSAGGNLALGTALLLRDAGGPKLRGILAIYPVCDADFETPSYREFGSGAFRLTEEKMRFYWSAYLPHDADRLHPLAAPLRARLGGLAPVLIQLAELDVLRSEGERMAEALRRADVPVEEQHYSGVIHGFANALGAVTKARQARDAGAAWLRRVLEA